MDKLVYKSFTWPQNPEYYRQSYVREPVYVKDEEGNVTFSGLGALKRTITGSGAFFGETAYENFMELAALCDTDVAGALTHPVWGKVSAFLTKLEMSQEPRADYVAYSFTFQVADADGNIPQ